MIENLPDEVLGWIMHFLPCAVVRCCASRVCARWRAIALDERAVGRRSCLVSWRPGWLSRCDHAARAGHVDCLAHARASGDRWSEATCEAAASAGHRDVLAYAHQNGCRWDRRACSAAAGAGALDCLRYLHQNGCPWREDTCIEAARFGRLDCLEYACAHGCPTSACAGATALIYNQLDCAQFAHAQGWLNARACEHAARGGSSACLAWAHSCGFPLDGDVCLAAAYADSLDCIVYLVERGAALHKDALRVAVRHDSLAMVRYMLDKGFPRDNEACIREAAMHGSRDVLAALLDAGICVTSGALLDAAAYDNFKVLVEIHRRGLDGGGAGVCLAAALSKSPRSLAFAIECGWPWGGQPTCEAAVASGNIEIAQLARAHGCRCKAWTKKFAPRRRRRLVARNAPHRRQPRHQEDHSTSP
ncbi:Ankyrin repeat protein [Pandoravirus kuranda]|uniref:Ankyrin repeat protein n=1 Tax=Pandoravirus kuranda TaxID=3019033 RepID=A0AA95EC03_9VIRU|nr:Ankyrin repeat protein [Pandoravirus kuranda]